MRDADLPGANHDLGQKVADILAADIISGRFSADGLLPREMDLVAQFGISRPTLRGSLQLLESVGLIRRVSGRGTFVRPYAEWSFLNPVLSRWIAAFAPPRPPFLRDLFSFRLSIEPVIAMGAAINARGKDIHDMEEAFAGMSAHVDEPQAPELGRSRFDDHDLAFHQAIYRATHNLIWMHMAPVMEPAMRLVIHRSNRDAHGLRDSLERHGRLLTCIRHQDPAGAYEAGLDVLRRTAFDLGIPIEQVGTGPACIVIDDGPAGALEIQAGRKAG